MKSKKKSAQFKAAKRRKLADVPANSALSPENAVAIDFGTKKGVLEAGSSGTDVFGGQFREEFLPDLQGQKAARIYDQMRRREAIVAMLLDAIVNPILSANWCFEVDDENDPVQLQMKRLCEWNFMHALEEGWEQFLREVLTFVPFGYSVFEAVHETRVVNELAGWDMPEEDVRAQAAASMPEPGANPEDAQGAQKSEELPPPAGVEEDPANEENPEQPEAEGPPPLVTFYKKLGFRKQESITRWLLERKTGKLLGIEQQTTGDASKQSLVTIPGEFCLVFTLKKEGDNYEGISALRPMYGAYLRKDLYLRLTAIGAEKNAVGTVIGTTPASKTNSDEDKAFEAVLEAYSGNESSYIKLPEGWKVEIQWGQFDPQKMVTLLNFENEEMSKVVVANFLNLGTGGNSGSLAVGGTLSNFFLNGIQSYAQLVCGTINRKAIPALCKLNVGEQKCYPKLKCTGINDKAGKELADIILTLTNAQALKPDDKLEDFLRSQYKLTKADPASSREKPAPVLPGQDPNDPSAKPGNGIPGAPGAKADPKPGVDKAKDTPAQAMKASERRIKFAEGYRTQFNANKAATNALMQQHLRGFSDDLVKKLRKNWEALGEDKTNATKGVSVAPGLIAAYKRELRDLMATIATGAIAQARKEVPAAAQKVKFGDYDKLNPVVKRAIERSLGLVADTQAADIEKIVLFQWASSSTQSSVEGIVQDIEEKIGPILEGSSNSGISLDAASGDAVAQVTQQSRNAFFFDPEVLDTIESFTFTNEDPVSEICQNLNGQTFYANDPNAEQFYPPLHHNCKSRLVPNGKGEKDVTGIAINAPDTEERARLEKQITLGCGCC